MKEFRDWDLYLQENYPVSYAVNSVVESLYRRVLLFPAWRLRDLKWAILHRFHPKHRYHVVKTSLKPGYYDTTDRILAAMGDEFARFYERALVDEHHIWDYSEVEVNNDSGMTIEYITERMHVWETMGEIYDWWMSRDSREDSLEPFPEIPEEWGMMAMFNDDFRDTDEIKEWRAVADRHHEAEAKWKREDQDMLHEIINIREYLWN